MKENILEYLGRKSRENKERSIKREDRYWKLSPIERIDYDNKLERIKRDNDYGVFPLTISLVRFLVYVFIGILLFYFVSGENLTFLKLGITLSGILVSLISWAIVVDFILLAVMYNSGKNLHKELNRRFKLCQ